MGEKLDFIRQADWLGKERVRSYSLILLLGSLAMMVNSFIKAMGEGGSDFLAFWSAGKVALAGRFADVFDPELLKPVQEATGFEGVFAFVNPPPFLFAVMPVGGLPYPLAWIAWVAATFAIWAAVCWKIWPKYWPLILAYPGALIAAGHAQNGLLTGALLVGGVACAPRRPWLGGALIGALVIKPHLALLMPFWLAAGRQWGAFFAAGMSSVGLLLVSWLAFGTETMLAYTESWAVSAQIMQNDDPGFYLRMATLYGQLRIYAGHEVALAVNAVLALAMIVMVWRSWSRFGGDMAATGALAVAATPLASPYLFNYDLPFLILPTLWLAMEARRSGFRPWDKLLLLALYVSPFATRAASLPLALNLMPAFSALMVWMIWQRGRKDPAGTT